MAKTDLFLADVVELPVLAFVSLRIPYLCGKEFIEFFNFVKLLNEEMIKTDIIIIGAGPVGGFDFAKLRGL